MIVIVHGHLYRHTAIHDVLDETALALPLIAARLREVLPKVVLGEEVECHLSHHRGRCHRCPWPSPRSRPLGSFGVEPPLSLTGTTPQPRVPGIISDIDVTILPNVLRVKFVSVLVQVIR